jgi:hypothetical protein
MQRDRALQSISDDELLRRLGDLIQASRRAESDLVSHIAEVDARRLYAREASPSMFAYCTEVLHLSEAAAYLRIAAARASREHPMLLEMLADGRLHLSGIARLAPHLTRENAEGLLTRAVHKSKRQIEELIAELVPGPDAPAVMRRLPARRRQARPTAGTSGAGAVVPDTTRDEGSLALGPHELEPYIELRPERVATSEPEPRWDGAGFNGPLLRPDAVSALPACASVARPAAIAEEGSASPAIPDGRSSSPVLSPGARAVVQPLSPGRYRVQFTANAELSRPQPISGRARLRPASDRALSAFSQPGLRDHGHTFAPNGRRRSPSGFDCQPLIVCTPGGLPPRQSFRPGP